MQTDTTVLLDALDPSIRLAAMVDPAGTEELIERYGGTGGRLPVECVPGFIAGLAERTGAAVRRIGPGPLGIALTSRTR